MLSLLKNRYMYTYNVMDDYTYDFDTHNSECVIVDIVKGAMLIREIAAAWDTAILRLKFMTTLRGKYFLPKVEVTNGTEAITYSFEHDANGVRYIDITPLIKTTGGTIRFTSRGLIVPEQKAELQFFCNPKVQHSEIVVVSPHPDDAEISSFGLYSSCDPHKTHIVTVTAGNGGEETYGALYDDKAQHFTKKGEIRVWNSITVPLLGGVAPERAVNLGYFDGYLLHMYENKTDIIASDYTDSTDINLYRKMNCSHDLVNQNASSNWNSLIADFCHIFKRLKPDIIVAPYPALNSNSDHWITTKAIFEAIKTIGIKDGHLFLYAIDNSETGGDFYPLGDIHEMIPLPPNFKNDLHPCSIYSHQLSIAKQKDKLFALEAMNDIRTDCALTYLKIHKKSKTIKQITIKAIRGIAKIFFGIDRGYLRRVVKGNEIFFVFRIRDIYDDDILKKL